VPRDPSSGEDFTWRASFGGESFTWRGHQKRRVDGKAKTPHHMAMAIFAVILSILALIFAIWLKEMGMKIFEESHYFKLLVAVALGLLILGIVLVKYFVAPVQGPANIGSLWSAFNELTTSASGLE
jgi:hypothetical protein